MGREYGKAGASWLVLVWRTECPERNWSSAKLSEPALQFRLSGVVRQASHVKNLAALRQECPNVCPGIHWSGKNIRMLVSWLRLADKTTEDSCKGDGLFHGAAGRCWGQCLEVKWQVVLYWGTSLNWLNFQGCADIRKH
jgi:hypothetical protein